MISSELLLAPIFNAFGSDATLLSVYGARFTIRAIDRTRGVPVTQNGVDTGTLAPGAAVKAADLAEQNLGLGDLPGSMLALNGKQWTVTAAAPVPGPDGEANGQVIMFLSEYGE